MKTLGFNHYNLRAPQPLLDRLRDFYRDVVGLRIGSRPAFKSFGYWLYAGDQDILHLTETAEGEVRQVEMATTFDHVAFTCSGRADFEAELSRRGIAYHLDVVPGTGISQLFLSDPAGNGVELNFSDGKVAPAHG